MDIKGKKINFLGSSTTYGHLLKNPREERYTHIIGQKTGAICRNYGVNGSTIARHFRTGDSYRRVLDMCMRAKTMREPADIVVIVGGTNDYGTKYNDIKIGDFEDKTPYTFCGALNHLSDILEERFPRARKVFVTPFHRMTEVRDDPAFGHKELDDYRNAIKENCRRRGYDCFDMAQFDEFDPRDPEKCKKYTFDGLHPNAAGHRILAERFIEEFEKLE